MFPFRHCKPVGVSGFFLILWMASSCVSQKKLSYLHHGSKPTQLAVADQYEISIGDNLYVEIKSPDPSTSSYYNLGNEIKSNSYNLPFLFINSFSVSETGEINLPHIGTLPVAGFTIAEVTENIEKSLSEHLREASVYVKLVSYQVTVLGEVQNPGQYFVYRPEALTIFEALGLAGDINRYGKKKSVTVIRTTQNETKQIEIDLTNNQSFASEAYFIYPNDVIYVNPIRYRSFEMNLKGITVLLSTAGLILLFIRSFN
jgi:polysaccharide export outer membrane protein